MNYSRKIFKHYQQNELDPINQDQVNQSNLSTYQSKIIYQKQSNHQIQIKPQQIQPTNLIQIRSRLFSYRVKKFNTDIELDVENKVLLKKQGIKLMEIKKNNDNHSNIEIKRKKSVKSNSKLSLLLDHQEDIEELEEIHMNAVQFQQRCKQWIRNID